MNETSRCAMSAFNCYHKGSGQSHVWYISMIYYNYYDNYTIVYYIYIYIYINYIYIVLYNYNYYIIIYIYIIMYIIFIFYLICNYCIYCMGVFSYCQRNNWCQYLW